MQLSQSIYHHVFELPVIRTCSYCNQFTIMYSNSRLFEHAVIAINLPSCIRTPGYLNMQLLQSIYHHVFELPVIRTCSYCNQSTIMYSNSRLFEHAVIAINLPSCIRTPGYLNMQLLQSIYHHVFELPVIRTCSYCNQSTIMYSNSRLFEHAVIAINLPSCIRTPGYLNYFCGYHGVPIIGNLLYYITLSLMMPHGSIRWVKKIIRES